MSPRSSCSAGLPGRRIAVLGEMLELGDGHEDGHREVGAAAAGVVDRLVVVGDGRGRDRRAARATRASARTRSSTVADRAAALASLRERPRAGDVVLVKASRGVDLDLLVDDLVAALGGPDATGR